MGEAGAKKHCMEKGKWEEGRLALQNMPNENNFADHV